MPNLLQAERDFAGSVGVESGADTRPPMAPPSPFDSRGAQFAWDATSLSYFMDCPWKYKAVILDGWRGKRGSAHLVFGGVYAKALETFHYLRANGTDHDEALERVVIDALIATWDSCENCAGQGEVDDDNLRPAECPKCEGRGGRPWESDHNIKTRPNLIRTIIWYIEEFRDDPLKVVILENGQPAVEHSFRLELDGGFLWCGHLDRLVTYDGDYYVQDQKTTGSTLSPYYFDQYNPDVQMSGYAFAAKALWHAPVKGVIVDAAQVAVGFSRFQRGFTFRTNTQLEEWYEDTLWWIDLARAATLADRFPRNRTSCTKYGGCVFREVCSRSPEVRGNFLKGDYEQGKQWNPLEVR